MVNKTFQKDTKKLSKDEIQKKIDSIFSKENPLLKDIKTAKKLAMSKNIKLGQLKQRFCKKCLSYYDSDNSEIRIKKQLKRITCKKCGYVARYQMK